MLQASFLNRKRVDLINVQGLNLDKTIWPSITDQLACPINIARDRISDQDKNLILFVKNSLDCDFRYFSDFYQQDSNMKKSNKTEAMTVILVIDPIKAAIQKKRLKEEKAFNMLGKVLIGSDCLELFDNDPDHLKWQLDMLIRRENVVILPGDSASGISKEDLKLYMEYIFGFILEKDLVVMTEKNRQPDILLANNTSLEEDLKEFKEKNRVDLFIYDFIMNYFETMLNAIKKINQQQYNLK